MTLPRSYSRHSLEFLIHGLRECLAREPQSDMAPRWRKALERAEAELTELKNIMGESINAPRNFSVDGGRGRNSQPYVAGRFKRLPNRKGARNGT